MGDDGSNINIAVVRFKRRQSAEGGGRGGSESNQRSVTQKVVEQGSFSQM